MKNIALLLLLVPFIAFSQTDRKLISEIKKFQENLNAEYKNTEESPLRGENFAKFNAHPYFPIDLRFRVMADFKITENPIPFMMMTSSGEEQPYVEYGVAEFSIEEKVYALKIFQSLNLKEKKGFENYLFLPFRDETNGKETYGGGKYIDLTIPKGGTLIIDFNTSYQPFCAYNAYDYSCPIVPQENFLPVEVKAGVKYKEVNY
ncbi:DUF1684 domain-containing protein [Chryseobacterium sp. MP_3.2]|uniref:DUF1684 domain-containing protein n=1 Tax=Chryseobacterium sp. MP_3.2 TaxID=3071712 RepID=UPI002E034CD8|nr:uncharacterized protein (DUF1684 family) [Chryseobacterium sp. MP_3.2]